MAAWTQEITFVPPATLATLLDDVDTLATAANATLDVAGAGLDAAKVLLTGTVSPDAAAAAALVTQGEGLIGDLFGAGLYKIFAHPWQHGVGHGDGVFRSLSFPNCVQTIAQSFDDQGDPARPQFSPLAPMEMVALIPGGPSPSIFAQVLAAVNTLIDSREFRLARRRLDQAFELERTRFNIVQGSRLPDWESVTVRDILPALRPLETALRELIAMLKGYAAGGNKAVDAALDLIVTKRAQLADLQNKLAAASALFGQGLSGAGVYGLHVTGAAGTAGLKAALLSASGAPGPELSFCAAVVCVGLDGTLAPVAERLNL
jgi:hypothetical protein